MAVVVSAPGKIFLMGEHAIVHGKPALLAAINLRVRVTVESSKSGKMMVETVETPEYVLHAVEMVIRKYGIVSPEPLRITVVSDIPPGYHLGSSAAVAVATVGAVTFFYKKLWNPAEINKTAFEVEKMIHGNPSGGDPAICTSGGFIWFRKELEFLRSIWQLPFEPKEHLLHFFLINTGRPVESTGEMVAGVQSKVESRKSKVLKLFDQNEIQTKRIAVAFREGNEEELIDAMRVGERTLEGMGVVSRKVMPLIRSIEKVGGAAKILGGGGRKGPVGFLLCYHKYTDEVEALCQPYGYSIKQIVLGGEGVKLEVGR